MEVDLQKLAQQQAVAQAAIKQFLAETASRIYAPLAADAIQKYEYLNEEEMKSLAAKSVAAANFLGETLGMITIQKKSPKVLE